MRDIQKITQMIHHTYIEINQSGANRWTNQHYYLKAMSLEIDVFHIDLIFFPAVALG